MDAPFGIVFLKKAELYNLICRFDKQYKNNVKSSEFRSTPWSIEKQILWWTYKHHMHLGSPIKTEHLSLSSKNNKLADFKMLDKKGRLKKEFSYLGKRHLTKPLENIVVRGFASCFDESQGHNAIVINKNGLLLGEVLADIEESNLLKKINYLFYGHIIDHLGAFILLIFTAMAIYSLLRELSGEVSLFGGV